MSSGAVLLENKWSNVRYDANAVSWGFVPYASKLRCINMLAVLTWEE